MTEPSSNSPLAEAQTTFANKLSFRSLKSESVTLTNALGRIAYEDIQAPIDSPPYPRAIVEGYLVNTAETKAADDNNKIQFTINGAINPGDETAASPATGEGILVATGSLIPAGEFSIVRMWEAEIDGNHFSISRPFSPGFFIEAQGCDIEKDTTVINAGDKISPEMIGTLASLGINSILVSSIPHVTVFASGDEVLPHTANFKPGYIYDCNTPMLIAAIENTGATAVSGGIQSDDFDAFTKSLNTALSNSDMVVIAGGTAIGGRDFISDLLKETGELILDGVPMRSGRPLIMGISNKKPIVCVAGHPPEALRGFKLFGTMAINYMTGHSKELSEE
ncbi:MAG: molybdopterin molybdotransferase MoeA [Gammaproteobacteria bacterium]|nr:molybdopterin molybdotransferase MoeA [Gammaproteobacteria bacterium]